MQISDITTYFTRMKVDCQSVGHAFQFQSSWDAKKYKHGLS